MFPALLAARPLIKYGIMIGVPLLILTISHTTVYFKGKAACQREQDAIIAQASMDAMRESVKADAMESVVVKRNDQADRAIDVKAETNKKEVASHAKANRKPIGPATVAIYDRLVSLPNEAGRSLPSPDLSPGASEISGGRVETEAVARVQDEEGNTIELTTEELELAAADWSKLYAKMKNKYSGFSEWNDGRERLELERLTKE